MNIVIYYLFVVDNDELIYQAGFFDGEGSIDISHVKPSERSHEQYCLNVAITQNDRGMDLLKNYRKHYGGSIYKRGDFYYQWHIHAGKAEIFLKTIIPYLRLKKEQAQLALEFRNLQYDDKGKRKFTRRNRLSAQKPVYEKFHAMKNTARPKEGIRLAREDGE